MEWNPPSGGFFFDTNYTNFYKSVDDDWSEWLHPLFDITQSFNLESFNFSIYKHFPHSK